MVSAYAGLMIAVSETRRLAVTKTTTGKPNSSSISLTDVIIPKGFHFGRLDVVVIGLNLMVFCQN